ncbi:hypothetical protein ACXM2N_01795 [Corynebacterium sp. ZY180755]|jgi:hypothetical protein
MTITGIVLIVVLALGSAILATLWHTGGHTKSSHQQLEDGTYVRNNDPKERFYHSNFKDFH